MARTSRRTVPRRKPLTVDQAVLAVLITAMNANQHVSPEEAARTQHLIASMRRFRHRSRNALDRLIETVRDCIENEGAAPILQRAARTIPARLRPSVFAVAADVVLVDSTLERDERRFLNELAADLKVRPEVADDILRVMMIKNAT
jgi:hypothetical protein